MKTKGLCTAVPFIHAPTPIEATIAPTKPGEVPAEKSDLGVVKSKAPGRPKKKETLAEKPSREAAKATGEMAKKVESHS